MAQEMVRRAYANGDIYQGTYEGWYCPNEGFRNADDVATEGDKSVCPNHPGVALQWLTERNWFFRLSAYQERLEAWKETPITALLIGNRDPKVLRMMAELVL